MELIVIVATGAATFAQGNMFIGFFGRATITVFIGLFELIIRGIGMGIL